MLHGRDRVMHTAVMDSTMNTDLLEALSRVVDEYGWAATTSELVANAAGVNRTTLYRNGHTTQHMLAAAAATIATTFKHATIEPLTAPGTAHERMVALLDALYELADQHLGLIAGLYDGPTAIFHMGGNPNDPTALTRLEYTEPFERLLTDGNTDSTLHSDDPTTDAELIFNTASWTYIHLRRSHQWSSTKTREAVTRITLAAFT